MRRKAIYAGSFDPITNGHLWMIENGLELCDKLTIAIGVNPDKKYMFTIDERISMIRSIVKKFHHDDDIKVVSFTNEMLIDYAVRNGINLILRGIRNESDYEFERVMRYINNDIDNTVTTFYLMPPRPLAEVSSSMIKGLVGINGWEKVVGKYVHPTVLYELNEKLKEKNGEVRIIR
jgi:pantetheine-phosphate adenylyltransferase